MCNPLLDINQYQQYLDMLEGGLVGQFIGWVVCFVVGWVSLLVFEMFLG